VSPRELLWPCPNVVPGMAPVAAILATLCLAKRARIILDASGTIPGREETMSGMGKGIGIAGLPTGSTFSLLAKSLWMMFSP
jgi:hypothetical protein